MENKNTLNGFETILDVFTPSVGAGKTNKEDIDNNLEDDLDVASEELTDEELEELRKPKKEKKVEKRKPEEDEEEEEEDDIDDSEEEEEEEPVKKTKKAKKEEVEEEEEETIETGEEEVITGFFDSLAQQLGWDDVEDDEKPKTAEDLIDYFKEVIEENSTPKYSSEEVEKLDEFVRNGGNLKDYFSIDADIDLTDIEVEDNEINQKIVVKELLKEKGYSAKSIEKKLTKYEEAGILEDEAIDALEELREIKDKKKEQLLVNQQKQAEEAQRQQQEFFENVVTEIKGMNSIYGVEVPEKDKRALLEYIFKADANGVTRYQKDYAKSLKNLITSAYFTMKGDSLIDIAKKKGKRDAIDTFKSSLTKNKGISTKSKKQTVNSNDDGSIWDVFTRQLRVA